MGHRATETTHNINNAFDPGNTNEHTVQGWIKFCKGDESLEDEECSGQPLEADNDNWEQSAKLILLHLHEKLPKNSMSTILWSFGIWSKLERWKSLISRFLMSWLQVQKNCHLFEVLSSLIPHNNNEPFLDWIMTCDKKWILYDSWWWAAQWLDREALKHFSKPSLHPKMSWSLFGGLLPVWSITASWIPAKPLHLGSMLNKSMRCTENCNAYSWHWSTERAQFSTTSKCTLYNQCFKSWMNWDIKFCLMLHWPLANQIPLQASTTFCRENAFTISRRQKMLSKSWLNSEARIFRLQE